MMNQFYRQAQVQGNMMGASVQQMKPTVAAPDIPLDKNLPVEELVNRMTYEQAKAVVIGGKGKFGGKSIYFSECKCCAIIQFIDNRSSRAAAAVRRTAVE